MITPCFIADLLMKHHKNWNFRIVTNIAVGRGINGVSYQTFIGECYTLKRNIYGHNSIDQVYDVEKTKILNVNIEGGYLKIEHTDTEDWLSKGARKIIYLDINSIVSIEIFTSNVGEWKKSTFIPATLETNLVW